MISLSAIMTQPELQVYINDMVKNYVSNNPIVISGDNISSSSRFYVPETEALNTLLSE